MTGSAKQFGGLNENPDCFVVALLATATETVYPTLVSGP
jgi:hypothetical protein